MTRSGQGRARVEAAISTTTGPPTLWFDVPEGALPSSALGDPFALGLLLPAMRSNSALVIEDAVSEGLLPNIRELQAVVNMWFPGFSRVDLDPAGIVSESARADGAGLFFSGGVDSFHSLLTEDPTHLVYVDMLDTFDEDEVLRARIRGSLEEVAKETGLELLTVSTNLRAVVDEFSEWARHSHSIALGAIAHALAGALGSCIITGDRTYDRMIPFGSHPLTIPMLGSGRLPIRTSGWGIWRVDRVATIADSAIAMKHLRVCWENLDSAYNCARCKKCLRTMTELAIWDALESCETFPDTLDLEAVRALEVSDSTLDYLVPALHRARTRSKDDLAAALEVAVTRAMRKETAEEMMTTFDLFGPSGTGLEEVVELHHEAIYRALSQVKGLWLFGRVLRDLPRKVRGKVTHLLTRTGRRTRP